MTKHKMGVAQLNRWGIGLDFAKDILFSKKFMLTKVIVSLEISGSSEDASIYQFTTNFIYQMGHIVTAETTGVWIDMMLRKPLLHQMIFWW